MCKQEVYTDLEYTRTNTDLWFTSLSQIVEFAKSNTTENLIIVINNTIEKGYELQKEEKTIVNY